MHAAAPFLRWWRPAALLLALLCGLPSPAFAQAHEVPTPPRESAVKAAFLYKFGAFVEWPPGTFQGPAEPLVIGVLEHPAVLRELEQITTQRTVEGRPLRVRGLRYGDSIKAIHVLFVGTLRPMRLRELLAGVSGPVLVVTQQPGALEAGSVINFTDEEERVRFAVSQASAEARRLRLSARLLAVAQSVEGRIR